MIAKKALITIAAIVATSSLVMMIYRNNAEKNKGDIQLYGNVDIREVGLSFRVMGKIDALYFDEGDKVKKGDLLATIDKSPYVDKKKKAQADVTRAKINMVNAKKQLTRRDKAAAHMAVSVEDAQNAKANFLNLRAEVEALEATEALAEIELSDTRLLCPSSGTILTRIKEVGSVVGVGESVFTLSLQSPLWIRCYVTEPELGLIYPGMQAEIITDTTGGVVYKGHIGFISPVAEFTPKNVETTSLRTDLVYRLRVIVDNADEGLRQGMPVTVLLKKNKELAP